jgi:hypothetical protein
MSAEIIKEVKERSAKLLNWIELTVDDPNAIKAAIEFFEYNESALKAIIKLSQIDLSASSMIELENKSITEVLSKYSIDRCFNEIEARKKLVNGLILVVADGYSFNGIYFEKGKDKRWI